MNAYDEHGDDSKIVEAIEMIEMPVCG